MCSITELEKASGNSPSSNGSFVASATCTVTFPCSSHSLSSGSRSIGDDLVRRVEALERGAGARADVEDALTRADLAQSSRTGWYRSSRQRRTRSLVFAPSAGACVGEPTIGPLLRRRFLASWRAESGFQVTRLRPWTSRTAWHPRRRLGRPRDGSRRRGSATSSRARRPAREGRGCASGGGSDPRAGPHGPGATGDRIATSIHPRARRHRQDRGIVFVCVGTPPLYSGDFDLTAVGG